MQNAGTYTIVMVVSETETFSGFNNSDNPLKVTIAQAEYEYDSCIEYPTVGSATFGNTLSMVTLEYSNTSISWSWQTPTDLVGNAGTQTHYAIYDGGNANYKPTAFELEVVVSKKEVTLTINNSTFTYNGKSQYITYTVTDGSTVLSNIAVDGNDGWTNAGNYGEVTLTIDDTNYSGSAKATVVVKKAKAVTQWPVYDHSARDENYYEDRVNAATDYTTAPKANTAGTWSYGTPTYGGGQTTYAETNNGYASNKAAIAGTFSVTFTPTDTTNYEIETNNSIAITIAPVAYNGDYSYGTIEKALNAASSGTVCVIVGTNPIINKTTTVKNGVILMIPYADNTTNSKKATLNGADDTYGSFSKLSLTNTVTIKSGVTLTVRGTLEIGGELSGGNGGCDAAGHTAGRYARILMNSAATIEVYGTVNAYGYIDESETDNGSQVIVYNGGTLWQPFVLRDFRGGTVMKAIYDNINTYRSSPFNSFEFRNITSLVRINHGGNVKAWANLYAGSQRNQTDINIIGTSDSIINLTDSTYSYVLSKYNRSTEINKLDIFGGAYAGSLRLKLTLLFIPINISTSDVYFPLTWRYHISLNKNAKQSGNAVYEMEQRYKMMPGHIFKVEKGAELTIGEVNVYETFTDPLNVGHLYPSGLPGAELIVNGSLTASVLGGIVKTESESEAQLNVSSNTITTYETKTATSDTYEAISISGTLKLNMVDSNGVASATATEQSSRIYTSMNYGWTPVVANEFIIIYDSNSGSTVENSSFYTFDETYVIDESILPQPTRSDHTFEGWFYTDANGTEQSVDGYEMTLPKNEDGTLAATSTSINLKAKWKKNGCFAEGTLITLADGSLKPIEEITTNDYVLAWDFESGQYVSSKVLLPVYHGTYQTNIIHLLFDDGTHIQVIAEHGFYNININDWIYINESNHTEYIGQEFVKEDKTLHGNGYFTATLINSYITTETTGVYSIIASKTINCFVEGMLTITPPDGIYGLFNFFEISDGIKYDEKQMKKDIETYGLYTYDEWSEYVTQENFEALNIKYLKVSVGKGLLTVDHIIAILNLYFPKK